MEKCLFNDYSANQVGYCHYHHCGITTKQLKCKECLKKQCHYLQKNFEHPYWIQKEVFKSRRKERKEKINAYYIDVRKKANI